jgi:hypothetical protein
MMGRGKWLSALVGMIMVAAPLSAFAEFNTDLRVKLGNAAGIDKIEFSNGLTGDVSSQGGGNFQVELVLTQKQESGVGLVGSVGLFGRQHSGSVDDPIRPTDIKYDAGGVSGSIGASVKANESLHFEGRFELGLGSGKPTLTTPGFVWNEVQEGGYSSASLIFGGYYTVNKPGVQIGLELGTQSFVGNFKIWNNAGYWADAKVKGSGGIFNLVFGYRF